MSTVPLKRYRVVVLEWLAHSAIITATGASAAEHKARRMWENNSEHEVFSFDDSGIDGVQVEELDPVIHGDCTQVLPSRPEVRTQEE